MNKFISIIKFNFFNRYRHYSTDAALRYFPAVNEIKKRKINNNKIVEIGSGSLGITPYLKKNITGIDIMFEGEGNELLKKIKASAIKLPFKNNTFDCVVSLDMLEHLEQKHRKKAIYEMLRIAKKLIIIGFPSGEMAEKEDVYTKRRFFEVMKYNDKYIEEHINNGLPDLDNVIKVFEGNKIKIIKNVNIHLHRLIINMQISKSKINNFVSSILFYYLIPVFRLINFGKCYRYILIININK